MQCLPLWLAPNLITITGLFVNIMTSLVLVYYNPDGKEEVQLDYMIYCNFESTFIIIEDHLNFRGRYGIAK